MSEQQTMDHKIIGIIAQQLGKKPEELALDKKFAELGVDSLDTTEMVMTLEQELNIDISDEEAQKLTTVGSVVEFAKSKT